MDKSIDTEKYYDTKDLILNLPRKRKIQNMKNEETQAINCRIPMPTYRTMQEIIAITKKTTGSFVTDAILYYVGSVTGEFKNNQPDYLKIDEFGYNLSKQKKGNNK